jgi:hypothetical protein
MGTLSVRGADKQAYFRASLSLERLAEPLAALTGLPAEGFLREAWTLILKNAAHDTACGSGIDAVAADARRRSEAALQLAEAVAGRGLGRIAADAETTRSDPHRYEVVVWNPSAFSRAGLVEVDVSADGSSLSVETPDGRQPGQPLAVSAPASSQAFEVRTLDVHSLLGWLRERAILHETVRSLQFEREDATIQVRVELGRGGAGADLDDAQRTAESLAATPGVERFAVSVERAPVQRLLIPSGTLEGFGWNRLRIVPGAARARSAVTVGEDSLENNHLAAQLESDGTITVRFKNLAFPWLHRLVDEADAGDEYNFSPIDQAPLTEPERVGLAWQAEAGPLRGALERELVYRLPASLAADRRGRSETTVEVPVRQRVALEANQARLDFTIELDNQAADHRLRVHFPLPFEVDSSRADSAFHVTRRPVVAAQLEDGASEWTLPTYPMRSFVDLSDGRRGLTLVTQGLHEFEVLPGPPAVLALTLIRSVGWLSRDDLRYRQGHAGPPLKTPGAQAFGPHRLEYSLVFHDGDWEGSDAWRRAEEVTVPLQLAGVHSGAGDPGRGPFSISLEPATIQLTACVPTREGFALRLLNASERPHDAHVRFQPPPDAIVRVSLGGTEQGPVAIHGGTAQVGLHPWEIVTLQVSRRPGSSTGS